MKFCVSFMSVCMQTVNSSIYINDHWRENVLENMALVHYIIHALQQLFSTYEREHLAASILVSRPSHLYSKSNIKNFPCRLGSVG